MAQPSSPVLAMYHGEPQLVKLTNGEQLIAVLYREMDDVEHQSAIWMDKPLRIHQIKKTPEGIVLFMERWLPVSIEHMFCISQSDVLVVGELSDKTVTDYLEVSGRLYGSTSTPQPTPDTEEEQRAQINNELMLRQLEHLPVRDVKH
jgi:hypothetical protein